MAVIKSAFTAKNDPGRYESLITEELRSRLSGIELDTRDLNTAEAADRIALHLSRADRAITGRGLGR